MKKIEFKPTNYPIDLTDTQWAQILCVLIQQSSVDEVVDHLGRDAPLAEVGVDSPVIAVGRWQGEGYLFFFHSRLSSRRLSGGGALARPL